MRVFIAIPVANQLNSKIEVFHAQPLFQQNMRPSHVEPHITLKAPQIVDDVQQWMATATEAIRGHAPLSIKGIKIDFITPHTLALFLEPDPLQDLQRSLATALAAYNSAGIDRHEVNFHPHVTIGRSDHRFNTPQQGELIRLAESFLEPYPTLQLNLVRLYAHDGHRYYGIKDIKLP
ncbi:MAG TPA: 2'-5' RNA ligase family protein [Candidatus Saccharimonadales bacterium]|nr:2'-5' RNA ligase family protein [Candidatus Saccharimonadales bacterium]